jgi:hypothetical protein
VAFIQADKLAVGVPNDDDGGDACGAVYVLFLNEDSSVASHQKISATSGTTANHLQFRHH